MPAWQGQSKSSWWLDNWELANPAPAGLSSRRAWWLILILVSIAPVPPSMVHIALVSIQAIQNRLKRETINYGWLGDYVLLSKHISTLMKEIVSHMSKPSALWSYNIAQTLALHWAYICWMVPIKFCMLGTKNQGTTSKIGHVTHDAETRL